MEISIDTWLIDYCGVEEMLPRKPENVGYWLQLQSIRTGHKVRPLSDTKGWAGLL